MLNLARGFSVGSVVKNMPAKAEEAEDMGLIPGVGRSPGEGMLAWRIPCTVHGVAESDTTERLSLHLSYRKIDFSYV